MIFWGQSNIDYVYNHDVGTILNKSIAIDWSIFRGILIIEIKIN